MKIKLMVALLAAAFAAPAYSAAPRTEPANTGIMGKIKAAFTPKSTARAPRAQKAPRIGRVERWQIVTKALAKEGHAPDSPVMRWAHKNLRRSQRLTGAPRTPEQAVKRAVHKARRKKKRAERQAAVNTAKMGHKRGPQAQKRTRARAIAAKS